MPSVFLENYECLQQWGLKTHSFLSLYPNVEHFTLPGVEGYIPYVETSQLVLAQSHSATRIQPSVMALSFPSFGVFQIQI